MENYPQMASNAHRSKILEVAGLGAYHYTSVMILSNTQKLNKNSNWF